MRRLTLALAAVLLAAAGCSTAAAGDPGGGRTVRVVAVENFWGSLAAQLGGDHATVRSIIDNPDADPHDYEPTVADARDLAGARLVLVNGVGYDGWAGKLVEANPVDGRTVLTVGDLVGVEPGGNPHRWYSPPDVRAVIDRITADYTRLDPADAGYFERLHRTVLDTD